MRKSKPKKRVILPDPKFGDVDVTKFVNNLMLDGKKSIAYLKYFCTNPTFCMVFIHEVGFVC